MNKKVKYLLPATTINMGGIFLKQAIPTQQVNQVDPFLLLHHADFKYNKNPPARHQGIGPHPHRGFTPVTFVINGEVHHRIVVGIIKLLKQERCNGCTQGLELFIANVHRKPWWNKMGDKKSYNYG